MGLEMVGPVQRYQRQCRALCPLGHEGYGLRSYQKNLPLHSSYTGVHHAEFYRQKGVVEWGVYKWMVRQARGHETRTRWDRLTRQMMKEWMEQWGITKKAKRRGRREGAVQDEVPDRGGREQARRGILLCAPLWLKGPRGKVQRMTGQWCDVYWVMFWETTSWGGRGRGSSPGDAQIKGRRCRGRS